MPALVDYEMSGTCAVIATHDQIAAGLKARYGAVATRLELLLRFAIARGQAGSRTN